MTSETELKLVLTPDAAEVIAGAAPWPGAADVVVQRSIYFDTPAQDLRKAGLSLRIRRVGRRRTQTVKAETTGLAGLFVRSEWERSVRNDTPLLDDTTPVAALIGDATEAIAPAFVVQNERHSWLVDEDGAVIEVALDRGEVVAGDRIGPICELELELRAGEPAALFALARRIDAIAPIRLGVQSKAERGYRLTGPAATMVKAEAIAFASGATAADAFAGIADSCVRHFRFNEALLLTGRDAGALHQARVALRRLRSAFSIFAAIIGAGRQAALRDDLRWLAAVLGDARNFDVLLARARPGALHDRLAATREDAYDRVGEALASSRARMLMIDLAEWIATGDWRHAPELAAARDQPVAVFAATALDRLRRKVRRDGRRLAHVDDERRHEVRKDTKKLRYAAEFFASLFGHAHRRHGRRQRRFTKALEALQDALGRLNDLATAPSILGQLGALDDPDAARLLAGRKRKALLAAAADARHDLLDARPFWR